MPQESISTRWEKAKSTFEETTHAKKPREKLVKFFKTSHTGLSGSMRDVDEAYDEAATAKTWLIIGKIDLATAQKALQKLAAKQRVCSTAMTNYLKVLDAKIKKETDKEPEVKSVWERGLEFLKKELAQYDAQITQYHKQLEVEIKDQHGTMSTQQKQVQMWAQNMDAVLKKGVAAIAKLKLETVAAAAATPDALKAAVKAYNDAIPGARGRDIYMQLVVAEDVRGLMATPADIKKRMFPWNTKNTETLDEDTATATDLTNKIKAFSTDVKAAVEWFGRTYRP